MKKPWTFVLAALLLSAPCAFATDAAADARHLAAVLDAAHVEQFWPAGEHVHWETGAPDGKPERGEGRHTHCSAFVAAIAKRLGVYILRPPEHVQVLLANAQYDWLAAQGASNGWSAITSAREAQEHANHGYLVVAAYRNRHDDKPGHIAIVRPSDKPSGLIAQEGPQITQAGAVNYTSTSLKTGFAGHPAAWRHDEVRFYAHAVDWQHLK